MTLVPEVRARARRHARRLAIALAASAAFALVLFGASAWLWVGATGRPFFAQYGIRRGCAFVRWFPVQDDGSRSGFGNPGFYASAVSQPGLDPWFFWRFGGTLDEFRIPLWPVGLSLGAGAAFAFRRARELRDPNICARCGYDRSGLSETAACPECGPSRIAPSPSA